MGHVLTVSRPRPDTFGGAAPVSFYASAGAELNAGIPIVNAPVTAPGESMMEALQRAVDHDRTTDDTH